MNRVSIVIPAYNAARTIGQTLTACLSQTLPCEVIVVDDGSTDNTPELARGFAGVKLLRQSNAGPATARNAGWRAASGELVFFTDSDCVPEKDWVEKLLAMFDSDEVGAAGGTYGIMNPHSLAARCIHYEIQFRHSRLPDRVRYLGTFSLAVRKSLLERFGGFDQSFRIACGEDADFTYRLTEAGCVLRFTREARVGHYFPESTRAFLRQQFWRGYWIMRLMKRHPRRLGRDDYSGVRDAVQPPLFFLIMLALPLCLFVPALWKWWLALNLLGAALQYAPAAFALRASSDLTMLYMFPFLYLRGFCWAAGCAWGGLAFWLVKK
ncbi:MAG: glycosyltransferase [Elusimicrobia bacterium]|nr:glycosyltransferase [Elusimicrobiota bacterium]